MTATDITAALESGVETQTGVLASGGVVAVGIGFSRLTGFAAFAAMAYAIGFTRLSDAYNLANNTPNLILALLAGGVVTATLLPAFVANAERGDDAATDAIVSIAMAAVLAVSVIAYLAAPVIVNLYTMRIHGELRVQEQKLATSLLRWFIPQIVLYGVVAMGVALLNVRRRFGVAAFAPAAANLAEVALFVAVHHLAGGRPTLDAVVNDRGLTTLLGAGTTAAVVCIAIPIVVSLWRTGWRPHVRLGWKHPAVTRVARVSTWSIGYVASNQVTLWITLILADAHPGGVAAWVAASLFLQLPHDLFAVSIMTALTPELSRLALHGDWISFRDRFAGGLRVLWLATVPAAVGYSLLSEPFMHALLQHGALTQSAGQQTARLLTAFAVGLPAFSTYLYAHRAYYALSDTRTPFWLNVFQNAVNIALAFPLEHRFGPEGLAVAFSLSYGIVAPVSLLLLDKKTRVLRDQGLVTSATQVGTASVIMAVVVTATRHIAGNVGAVGQVLCCTSAGLLSYVGLVTCIGNPEASEVIARARSRLRVATAVDSTPR